MNRRNDQQTAFIIDAAIHTCSAQGVQVAALVLSDHDVALGTILRVLTSPRQRRGVGQRSALTGEPVGDIGNPDR